MTTTLTAILLCGALAACANSPEADRIPGPGETSVSLEFEAIGDTETACGEARGVYLSVRNVETGALHDCMPEWVDVSAGPDYTGGATGEHPVLDCLMVLEPGEYEVNNLFVIGTDGHPLPCCEADHPPYVTVDEHETTEIGAKLTCQVVGTGSLDIYGWLNRAPRFTELDIVPSKFASVCNDVMLAVTAADPEGDLISYAWTVLAGPDGFTLTPNGNQATFSTTEAGDYTVEVVAEDEHGASAAMTFPLHMVGDHDADCDDCVDDGACTLPGEGCGCADCAALVGSACDTGQPGLCAAGTRVCTDGELVCEPEQLPVPETCDGVDEDCDGEVDENLDCPESCEVDSDCDSRVCDNGTCQSPSCNDGVENGNETGVDCGGSCAPCTSCAVSDATCDGVDDDCDGTTDEDFQPTTTSCGTGACAATGMTQCSGGTVTDTCSPGTPGEEDGSCDGIDNDCDGIVDETC